jgi:DNA modification methylase
MCDLWRSSHITTIMATVTTVITATLLNETPRVEFMEGDCLKCLDSVENESVQTIYLDPPFDSDRDYMLSVDSSVGFTDKWAGDAYKRFINSVVAKCVPKLKKTGTLFFHISADRMFVPECVLREHFKFVQPIFWKRCRSKNNVKAKLGATIDIIFKCTQSPRAVFNVVHQPKDEKYLANSFKNKDAVGNYALGHLVTESTKKGYMYSFTIEGRTFNPAAGWRIQQEELHKLHRENRLHVPKGKDAKLYKKIYLHENPGKPCTDLWDDIHSIGQGSELRKYPTAKPQKLLERVIAISTNPGDRVLDPMCGSGTTGAACVALGRSCVLMDRNPDVLEIVRSRFHSSSSSSSSAVATAAVAAGGAGTATEDEADEEDEE